MDKMKNMKENLMAYVQVQMGNLQNVDAKELGEAIDMIKDLEEAMYYCSIVKAMEENQELHKKEQYHYYYYTAPSSYANSGNGGGNNGNGGNSGGGKMYYEDNEEYPLYLEPHQAAQYLPEKIKENKRDYREGRSPISRRKYMESKEMFKDEKTQKYELEEYMNELTHDIMEMIAGITPDQKVLLTQKLNTLASKIQQA